MSTIAWIGVTIRNSGARCSLGGAVTFTILQAGDRAAVRGNPLEIATRAALAHRRSRLVKAGWSNWCRSRAGLRLVVRYAGKTLRTRFHGLPACLSNDQASRLAPID